jgi:hypothetical protein
MKPALPLQQDPRFAAALRSLGAPVRDEPLPQNGTLYILQRFGLRFATRGPVWDAQTPTGERADTLRRARLHLLNADSADPAIRQAGFRQTHTGASVAEMVLDDKIMQRLHPKWRATWRKAQASGLTLGQERWCARRHDWLLRADLAQQRKAGFRALPHALIPAFAAIAPDAVMVHTAWLDNSVVAAMVFLQHAPVVTYHLGWTGDLGRKTGAHYLILTGAAAGFGARGCHRLDLGGVDTDNSPGLARFKIGTGASIRTLGGTWIKVPGL